MAAVCAGLPARSNTRGHHSRWAYMVPALQGEIDRLPGVGTADHRFGPLHVMHARFEGDHRDLLRAASRVGELFLHAVVGLLLRRVWDLRELLVPAVP